MSKISFYQRAERQIVPRQPGVETEIAISDVTLEIYRFSKSWRAREEFVSVKVSAFTDCMSLWRDLDRLGVFDAIEAADLRDSDDVARILVARGLHHVPYAGSQYAEDEGASERARIRALHAGERTR